MNQNKFIESIMHPDYCRYLTICGSAKYRELKEKYQAYYTIKNNVVFAPVNYLAIKNEVETSEEIAEVIANNLAKIHDKKINLCEAIIVVTDNTGYYGSHTAREIQVAKDHGKRILFTHIDEKDLDKYDFNNELNYPLYMSKEE